MQVAGVLVIALWTIAASAVVLFATSTVFSLRVSEEEELEGLDIGEHGVSVYPEFIGESSPDRALGAPTATDGGSDVRTDGGVEAEHTSGSFDGGEDQ
jgi:Amt family ammonium transporter